ncbi:IS200/IS605 family transposase [Streptomyces sp. NPDC004787]|uniref:IS200/IS605 family transposase n=1 Tax=Streptomyces sp. NPDC004787 TaxID=3154291 RepID=UPI0033AA0D68
MSTDDLITRCEEIMWAVCANLKTELVEFNGERYHVHLLLHQPPKVAISRLVGSVGSLKGASACTLRQEFSGHVRTYPWGGHVWSPPCFAASCGGSPLTIINEYFKNQKLPG